MKIALKTEGMNCILRFENQVEHPEEIETERILSGFIKQTKQEAKIQPVWAFRSQRVCRKDGRKIRADVTGFCFSIEIKFPMVQ